MNVRSYLVQGEENNPKVIKSLAILPQLASQPPQISSKLQRKNPESKPSLAQSKSSSLRPNPEVTRDSEPATHTHMIYGIIKIPYYYQVTTVDVPNSSSQMTNQIDFDYS